MALTPLSGVPPDCTVVYDIDMPTWEPAPEKFELDKAEQVLDSVYKVH